jgi:hypothetical protein
MTEIQFALSSTVDNGGGDETPIDQAYLTHIEEQDFDTVEKIRRVRFKGVWSCSWITRQWLTSLCCVGPSVACLGGTSRLVCT